MICRMSEIIYPRSPRETMDGWHYLPRYIDKVRLHLAGKLHADYQENLGKAFDGFWRMNNSSRSSRTPSRTAKSVTGCGKMLSAPAQKKMRIGRMS
jgi:Domain of unknown function (DUF5069)